METSPSRSRGASAAAALLLLANVVVPLVWGDVYPFTSAPMFRDAPRECCRYRVLAVDGRELPAEDWLLQRVYDGNPVGYGVGLRPPPVLEAEYGIIHDEATVRRHVERQFARSVNQGQQRVEIVQEVLGGVDGQRVGVVRCQRWQIDRVE